MVYENILTEVRGRVGLVTLNRPRQLNALNDALMNELGLALDRFESDDEIGAIVIARGDKAFAVSFEIIQRVGNYDAYGALNAPARMASQAQHVAVE